MPSMEELRARSAELFASLGRERAGAEPTAAAAATARGRPFSWFDPDDAAEAVGLAARMAIASGAAPTEDMGLQRALDLAEQRAREVSPELVAQALAIFVTHHTPARQLARPRTVRIRPELFTPSAPPGAIAVEGAAEPERALDYWREDPFANEHHSHWHQVYPFPGLPVQEWLLWAETSDRAGLADLLRALDPTRDWPAFLAAATAQQILDEFFPLANAIDDVGRFLQRLSPSAYRVLFRLNDRQGELFFYMHSQMLARYDSERLSHGMQRVAAFSPDLFGKPIPEAYSPNLPGFTDRAADEKLPQRDVDLLNTWQAALDTALAERELLREVGPPSALDSNSLGEAVEAAQSQLTGLRRRSYPGMHNQGHGMFASLPDDRGTGVMNSPAVAIRDPVFWRWHKHIDDVNVAWQDTQPPYDFSDAPPVVLRDALSGAPAPWASPDVLLVSTAALGDGADPAALATAAVGGAAFDTAVGPGPLPGAEQLVVVDELTTRFLRSTLSNGQTVTHLSHDPFALIIRVRNATARPTAITLRVFLAPAEHAGDRTTWMELDKLLVEVPASGRSVVYRPDTEFSVVKKPAETDPQTVLDGENDPNDPDYCDCGWPYTLLLPRGTPEGMTFRLAVFCTDAARDLVRPSAECGSMSFCGAVDRYPDTRDMGYPFSRPFARPVPDTILGLPSAAGQSFTIRHQP
jgi:Hemocyanin, ig-like domain/Hemocyanin, copper containing domain